MAEQTAWSVNKKMRVRHKVVEMDWHRSLGVTKVWCDGTHKWLPQRDGKCVRTTVVTSTRCYFKRDSDEMVGNTQNNCGQLVDCDANVVTQISKESGPSNRPVSGHWRPNRTCVTMWEDLDLIEDSNAFLATSICTHKFGISNKNSKGPWRHGR